MKDGLFLIMTLALIIIGCAGPSRWVEGRPVGPNHWVKVRPNEVLLYLDIPKADRVEFICSLDEFQPRTARRDGNGDWVVSVPPGEEFRYFYLVDGIVYLPECQEKESDDFGSANCIFTPSL